MKIGIIGSGALGGIYGSLLSGSNDVIFITRRAEHAEAIHQRGITLIGDKRRKTYRLHASHQPQALKNCELIIVLTKTYQLKKAATQVCLR